MKLTRAQFISFYLIWLAILAGLVWRQFALRSSVADVLAFMTQPQLAPQVCHAMAGFSWANGRVDVAGQQVNGAQAEQLLQVKRQNIYCAGTLPTGKTLADTLPSSAKAEATGKGCYTLGRFKVCPSTVSGRVTVMPD